MEIPTAFRAAAFAAFFLSGVAALVYQVVWQRMLVAFSGADVYSSTVIIAAFMAGLGIGNLAGGHVADRIPRRKALILFAGAEACIALFSVLSRRLYYDFLYQGLGGYPIGGVLLTAILFTSLLWPTFFMGVSLPLLARAVTSRLAQAAGTIGALYAVNTLGAASGALLATWWVLPSVGLDGSLRIGAVVNLLCAGFVLPFALRAALGTWEDGPISDRRPTGDAESADGHALPFAAWAAVYALSGLIALSLEIVWFRLLGVMMKSTAFTFGTLLTLYLTGIGLGAWAGSLVAPRVRRPAVVFLLVQAAAVLSAGALVSLMVSRSFDLAWLHQYFASYDPFDVREAAGQLRQGQLPREFLLLYFALPALMILPPTLMMGFSFPVLQRIVQTDFARLGRRVGLLMVANIAGSVAGTMLTGWAALDLLGTAGTLKALAAVSSVFLVAAVVVSTRGITRVIGVAAAAVVVGAIIVALPEAPTLWARLHGATPARMIAGEDATGVSVLRLEPGSTEARATVFVNGVGQSTIPYGDVHTGLGMVPAFLHPDPREVAIIGLGSGDTVYGVAGRREIARITCVEIIAPQIDGLRQLRGRLSYDALNSLFADPRIELRDGDGRIFLMHSPARFDIIEADALRPSSAYSGNLYSEEYFTLMRNRLRPRGLAATWLPTVRVHNAFVRAFPYVVSVPGILIGSNDPIEIDRDRIAARLAAPGVRDHYARAGINVDELMASYLVNPARYTPGFPRESLTDYNTDLFPRDEFDLSDR